MFSSSIGLGTGFDAAEDGVVVVLVFGLEVVVDVATDFGVEAGEGELEEQELAPVLKAFEASRSILGSLEVGSADFETFARADAGAMPSHLDFDLVLDFALVALTSDFICFLSSLTQLFLSCFGGECWDGFDKCIGIRFDTKIFRQ